MIKNKKIYASILILSLVSTGTYSSYAYFTDQSIKSENVISIAELDKEEGSLEVVEAKVNGDTLELKFSKRIYYPTDNILEGITGDNSILENSDVTIDKNFMYIKKTDGSFNIPDNKDEKNLPKISLENFEDRFGNKINAQDIYFYKSQDYTSTGILECIIEDKDVQTDVELIGSYVEGISSTPGTFARTSLEFINSDNETITMNIVSESRPGSEELSNNKEIKIIPSYGSSAHAEWAGDVLEIYLCYGKEYNEADIQEIVDNVINIDNYKRGIHEFDIERVVVDFNNENDVLRPTLETQEAMAVLGNAKNTIAGKKTRGSIDVNGDVSVTGRFNLKITDDNGLNIQETFLAIEGDSSQKLMTKIISNIHTEFDREKYIITLKDNNTRLDLTSKNDENTGLKIEIEKL